MNKQAQRYAPLTEFEQAQEARLLVLAQSGDRKAMQKIYQRYASAAFNLAFRLLNNYADAQDVVQESFIKCFRCLHQYKAEALFWSWLRAIVSTTALMQMRSKKSMLELDAAEQTLDQLVFNDHEQTDASDFVDQQQMVNAIQQLPDLTRAVVWLYHVEGYTHKEIAAQFERSISFSKTRLARGNAQLRQQLIENNEVSELSKKKSDEPTIKASDRTSSKVSTQASMVYANKLKLEL